MSHPLYIPNKLAKALRFERKTMIGTCPSAIECNVLFKHSSAFHIRNGTR